MNYIGKKIENIEYKKRPGAYAIITRQEDNKIALATNGDFFFLGGGIENGETEIDALRREIIEEAGYSIKNIKEFDKVGAYLYDDLKGYLDIEATIYTAEFDKEIAEPVEKDHKVIWVEAEAYKEKLSSEYQRYVLDKYSNKILSIH